MLTGGGTVAPKVTLSNNLIGLNCLNVLNDSSEASSLPEIHNRHI
jgi:hypothetical protein